MVYQREKLPFNESMLIGILWIIAFFGYFLTETSPLLQIIVTGFFLLAGIKIYVDVSRTLPIQLIALFIGSLFLVFSTSRALTNTGRLLWIILGSFFILHPLYKYKEHYKEEKARKEKVRKNNQ